MARRQRRDGLTDGLRDGLTDGLRDGLTDDLNKIIISSEETA